MSSEDREISIKTIAKLVLTVAACLIALFAIPNFVEHLDATQVMVIQYPTGRLVWHTTPGYKAQWFGTVTKYNKRSQYWFSAAKDQGAQTDQSIKVRFNDGGHAQISGSIAWEIPMDEKSLTQMHVNFGSQEAVEQKLVRTNVEKSVYMTGPLMSSKESSAERRNDLIRFMEDQIQNGIYQTRTEQVKEPDPVTGLPKTVNYVRLVETDGKVQRQENSPLSLFGIHTSNLSLNNVAYDAQVEGQINAQQQATMQVQTAIAKAKEAEQAAITAAKNGEAEAAKAKWEQEVIKARAVTEAEQKLRVAELETQAAEQEKKKQILLGEGEAERRKLVMAADGALKVKLDTWLESQKIWADAFKGHNGPLVPSVVMGGSGENGGQNAIGNAQNFMNLLGVKAARDLALDMQVTSQTPQQTAHR